MSIAKKYGGALFLIGEESGLCEKFLSELELFSEILTENPDYAKILDTPAIAKEKRVALIDEALGAISEPVVNTVKLLSEQFEVHSFDETVKEYKRLFDESLGVLRVLAITAVPMSQEQLGALKEKLDWELSVNAVIENKIDPTILGGIILRYGDVQRDASLKSRLDEISQKLSELII